MSFWLGGWLIVLPLLRIPSLFESYETPKAFGVILLTLGWVAIAIVSGGLYMGKLGGIAKASLSLLVILIGSSLYNQVGGSSWWGNPYRMDGLLTLSCLIVLALGTGSPSWPGTRVITRAAAIGSTIIALINIVQYPAAFFYEGFGNPNILVGYLVVALPFTYEMLRSVKGYWSGVWMMALLLQASVILLARSWGGVLGLLIFTALVVIKKWRAWHILSVVVVGLIVVGGYFYHFRINLLPAEIVSESRERILFKGLLAIKEKPLTGWGYAQFSRAFNTIDWPFHFYTEAYVDRAHSSLLEIGVAGGLGSLVIYLFIIGQTLLVLWKNQDRSSHVMAMVVVLYLVHSQTNVTSVVEDLLFWLGVGTAIALKRPTNS